MSVSYFFVNVGVSEIVNKRDAGYLEKLLNNVRMYLYEMLVWPVASSMEYKSLQLGVCGIIR